MKLLPLIFLAGSLLGCGAHSTLPHWPAEVKPPLAEAEEVDKDPTESPSTEPTPPAVPPEMPAVRTGFDVRDWDEL